ncbi:sugar-binding protein [Flagellimonas myxillae]|uniref:sugar-binding protein n=1 Tax=Flagellimonas myxillae TaxID=2942214 RepID=UPI00201F7242|nr:sugar-binding protein [Muricauda myxillae]MCL6265456.1 hypothetical protein [Muricauda myxillae]
MKILDVGADVYAIQRIDPAEELIKFPSSQLWERAQVLQHFSQPWGDADCPKISFRALHNYEYLFLRYQVTNPKVLIFEGQGGKMDVVQSERVEIFLAQDPKLQTYYCLEIDPSERILDYTASFHRDFDYNWSWPKGHLFATAQIRPEDYQVDVRISKESLEQLGLIHQNRILAGIYLGHCEALPDENCGQSTLNWLTWIDPKRKTPDFHVPATFGTLELMG